MLQPGSLVARSLELPKVIQFSLYIMMTPSPACTIEPLLWFLSSCIQQEL